MENHRLKITALSKKYLDFYALDNIDISFGDGIYGVLGPNGAGKSTLMKILTLGVKPTNGHIFYEGKDIYVMNQKYLTYIGYVPQQQSLYKNLTALEFMYYIGHLKGIDKQNIIDQSHKLLFFVHLYEDKDKKIGTFSGGMKQRLLIAQSLLGNPKIILLDEPTAGVDPMERVTIRKIIDKISLNRTIIITTHIISDIESIANYIIMMSKGKIIHQGIKQDVLRECLATSLEEAYVHVFNKFYDDINMEKI